MSEDAVRVAVRVRPLSFKEVSEGCENALEASECGTEIRIPSIGKRMTYDHVFSQNGSQQFVYESTVQPLLKESFFKGYNATVLAYGQTGSGKTYTMGTELNGTSEEGIIPRCVRDLFEKIESEKNEATKWTVTVSFLEVYKEVVRDLLRTSDTVETSQGLPVREDSNGDVYVKNLTWIRVSDPREMLTCLQQGTASRVTGKTGMNLHSSRSHAIFAIRATRVCEAKGDGTFSATLRLVDLAGSERQKKTKAQGGRLREGISINKGLLALGNCISALGDPQKRAANVHVPYRDSKLTRLLQSALGGNSRTCMIACVSPADSSLDETMCTLRYAHRARNIQNKAVLNVDPNKAHIQRLENQVMTLQQLLIEQRRGLNSKILKETKDFINGVVERAKEVVGELEVLRHRTGIACLNNLTEKESSIRDHAIEIFENSIGSIPLQEHRDPEFEEEKSVSKTAAAAELLQVSTKENEAVQENGDTSELDILTREIAKMNVTSSEVQGKIQKKIVDVSRELQEKEMLLKRTGQLEVVKNKCIEEIGSLTKKIEHIEKEKCEVEKKFKSIQEDNQTGAANLKRMYAEKLRNLKLRIKTLSKRHEEQKRLLTKKESEIKRAEQVRTEMLRLKTQKAGLQKDLKIQNTKARELQREKERKIHHLQQMRRKQDIRLEKLKSINERQAVVSKRRAEQLKAERNRNQELLRRKANVRDMKKTSAFSKNKKKKNKANKKGGAKVRQWVTVELSYMKSGIQPNCRDIKDDKTRLQGCFKQRAQIMRKMESLRKNLPLLGKHDESDAVRECRNEMARLQSQREIVKAEIAVLQRAMLLQDQESKKSTGWQRWVDRIQNLPQAMAAMKVLYNHIKTSSSSGSDDLNVTPTKNKCVTPTRRRREREQIRPEIARSTSKMIKHVTPPSNLTEPSLLITQLKDRTRKHVTPPQTVTDSVSLAETQLKGKKAFDSSRQDTNEKRQNKKKDKKNKKRLSSDSTKSFGSAKSDSADQKQRDLRRWRRERDKIKPKKRNLKRSIAVGFESGEESEWSPGSEDEEQEEEYEEVTIVEKKKKKCTENKDKMLNQVIERWRSGELNKSTVSQLKVVLKHFDCKVSGRKADLVDRTSEVLNKNYGSFAYVPQGEENEKMIDVVVKSSTTKKKNTLNASRRFGCDITNGDDDNMNSKSKSKKKKKDTTSSTSSSSIMITSSSSSSSLKKSTSKKEDEKVVMKKKTAWENRRPSSMHSSKMR